MATFTFFDEFKRRLGSKEIDLDASSDVYKFMLTATAPNVDTHDDKADLTEISATGSYAAVTITNTWQETSAGTGIYRFAASADPSWTASGGTFDNFRYVVLYNDTHANDSLIGYFDSGGTISLTTGNTFTLDLDSNFELFTLDG